VLEDKECDSKELHTAFENSDKLSLHFSITRYEQFTTVSSLVPFCHKIALFAVVDYISRVTAVVMRRRDLPALSSVSHEIMNSSETTNKTFEAKDNPAFTRSLQILLLDCGILNTTTTGFDLGETLKSNCTTPKLSPYKDSKFSIRPGTREKKRGSDGGGGSGGGSGGGALASGLKKSTQSSTPQVNAGRGGGGGGESQRRRGSR